MLDEWQEFLHFQHKSKIKNSYSNFALKLKIWCVYCIASIEAEIKDSRLAQISMGDWELNEKSKPCTPCAELPFESIKAADFSK